MGAGFYAARHARFMQDRCTMQALCVVAGAEACIAPCRQTTIFLFTAYKAKEVLTSDRQVLVRGGWVLVCTAYWLAMSPMLGWMPAIQLRCCSGWRRYACGSVIVHRIIATLTLVRYWICQCIAHRSS